jgi:hypothetical protein
MTFLYRVKLQIFVVFGVFFVIFKTFLKSQNAAAFKKLLFQKAV